MKSVAELANCLRGRVYFGHGRSGSTWAHDLRHARGNWGATIIALDMQRERCEEVARLIATRHGVETWPLIANLEHADEVIAASEAIQQRLPCCSTSWSTPQRWRVRNGTGFTGHFFGGADS